MRKAFAVIVGLGIGLLGSNSGATGLQITPTTTLAAQTANNTSTASTFRTQTNNNLGASNISKLPIRSLLYPGSTTKIYAHFVGWFGGTNHISIGYVSNDATQVHRQVEDMVSRGIDGMIINWYGPGANRTDLATQMVMHEAELHPGFTFSLMEDKSDPTLITCSKTAGCDITSQLISNLTYIAQTYFPSSGYQRIGGRPVLTNFDLDLHYTIDWARVVASVPGNPVFIFQNSAGFSHSFSGGSYQWIHNNSANTLDWGSSGLSTFYNTGLQFPSEETVGATFKGFNDALASWGLNRIMSQQCGQVWLNTFGKINSIYNSGKQLDDVQLVTWNDYEEGTELESGVDNCVSVSGSVTGSNLAWSITGNENTIDHYTIYISADGQGLMPLMDMRPGNRTLNLASFSIPGGTYALFVQAVGKPSMKNQMSNSIVYTNSISQPGSGAGDFSITATAVTSTVPAGHSAGYSVVITPQNGFNSLVALSCSGLPAGASCTFSSNPATPNNASNLSISTSAPVAKASPPPAFFNRAPLYALWLPLGITLTGLGAGVAKRKRVAHNVVMGCILIMVAAAYSGCSMGPKTAAAPRTSGSTPAGTYAITIIGASGAMQHTQTTTLTVQ